MFPKVPFTSYCPLTTTWFAATACPKTGPAITIAMTMPINVKTLVEIEEPMEDVPLPYE